MKKDTKNQWNLKLLYSSIKDPQIEKDIVLNEKLAEDFAKKYNTENKEYLTDLNKLLEILKDYEQLLSDIASKPILYLYYSVDIDSTNTEAVSLMNLYNNRLAKAENNLSFFKIALGKISADKQKEILSNKDFAKYHFLLRNIFSDAKHNLTEAEEKIMNLKAQTASQMWTSSHDRILSAVTVDWKGKKLPIAEAMSMIKNLKLSDRAKLSAKVNLELKKVSIFSEAEMNAVVTDHKVNDELRGFKTPYESTVVSYRNDPKTVEKLVDVVTKNFPVAHEFYKIKAKLLKQKNLRYFDRSAKYATIEGKFDFESSRKTLEKVFGDFHPRYADILNSFIKNGQVDVFPRKGKTGGAYCSSSDKNPTFILLNHINDFRSLSTIAHEFGHAFHSELSKPQAPLYSDYSFALAETASTFFESLAFEAVVEILPEKQKIVALHERVSDDISTIFRQIACFNYEKEIHASVREKGFVSKEEFAEMHNKHMKAYLGPVFKMEHDDGYMFVQWSHIRRFFYVYSYAYGLLVSKAMLKRYRENKEFRTSIEKFLSAGGKDTPENILKEIGIDVTTGELFKEGIEEIERDIKRLGEMVKKMK